MLARHMIASGYIFGTGHIETYRYIQVRDRKNTFSYMLQHPTNWTDPAVTKNVRNVVFCSVTKQDPKTWELPLNWHFVPLKGCDRELLLHRRP